MNKVKFEIRGKVIKGDGYGKTLGFPTANLDRRHFNSLKEKPKPGVWAGIAKLKIQKLKFKTFLAAIVIGPKDKKGLLKVEAHLINFKGNLYKKSIEIQLISFVRSFKKYSSQDELKKQIELDVKNIIKIIK